jgi:hypothetical protein
MPRVSGFVISENKDKLRGAKKKNTLEIKVVCAKKHTRHDDKPIENAKSVGKIMLNLLKDYASIRGLQNIELEAYPYVIGYYASVGYQPDPMDPGNKVGVEKLNPLLDLMSKTLHKTPAAMRLSYYLERIIFTTTPFKRPNTDGKLKTKIAKQLKKFLDKETSIFSNNPLEKLARYYKDGEEVSWLHSVLTYLQENTVTVDDNYPITMDNIVGLVKKFETAKDAGGPVGVYQLLRLTTKTKDVLKVLNDGLPMTLSVVSNVKPRWADACVIAN